VPWGVSTGGANGSEQITDGLSSVYTGWSTAATDINADLIVGRW
jgi:hypothetical protein